MVSSFLPQALYAAIIPERTAFVASAIYDFSPVELKSTVAQSPIAYTSFLLVY